MTQWAGQAWDEVCKSFGFAAAARKVGMLMTIDGSNDDLISIDGVDKYAFTKYVNRYVDEAETDEGGGVGGVGAVSPGGM